MSVVTRRERLRADTEEQIVAVAREILTEDGLPAVTLRAIAGRVGMTAPALYRYVASRDEIIWRMCDAISDDLAKRVEAATDRTADRTTLERTIALIRAYRTWALERPAEYTLVFISSEPGVLEFWEPDRMAEDPVYRAFIGVVTDIFAEGNDRDVVPGLHAAIKTGDVSLPEVRWMIGWWERLHGAVMLEAHRRFPFVADADDAVFDAMLADLAADIRRLRGDHG